jgi:hypothetical protein
MKRHWEEVQQAAKPLGKSPAVVFLAVFTLGLALASASGLFRDFSRYGQALLPVSTGSPLTSASCPACPKHTPAARASGVRTLLFHLSPRRGRAPQNRQASERIAEAPAKQGGSTSALTGSCFSAPEINFPEMNLFRPLL